jgi:two-component system, NtrC family, sensor kinase
VPRDVSGELGLRTQLLFGLALIILVTSLSVGILTTILANRRVAELELERGRLLGEALASLFAAGDRSAAGAPSNAGPILAAVTASGTVRAALLCDASLAPLGSSGLRAGEPRPRARRDLSAAVGSGRPIAHLDDEDRGALRVTSPLFARGRTVGAVQLLLPVSEGGGGGSSIFFALLAVDGLCILFFVGLVLTRTVIRPVEELQRAASHVADGDLSVELHATGSRELSSLAASFNAMTSSVREKLEHLEKQRRELAASREQLIRSEKLASLGRLAAGVAHEIGNPLQSIIGLTDLLLSGGLSPEESGDLLGRTQAEAARIHRTIRELLDYARPVEAALEAVALGEVVSQALQLALPQKKLRGVEVEREGLEGLAAVAANGQRLVQVVVNLLLNAADAMAGGRGRIRFDGRELPEKELVELRVSNSGAPIPEGDRGRIFDPFFTTKEPGEGTGLGLSVALSIVESYGGTLILDGTAGETTFVIALRASRSGVES